VNEFKKAAPMLWAAIRQLENVDFWKDKGTGLKVISGTWVW